MGVCKGLPALAGVADVSDVSSPPEIIKSARTCGESSLFAVSEITPSLYLCGASSVKRAALDDLRITCVISATPELPRIPLPSDIQHYSIYVTDSPNSDLASHFHFVTDLIHQIEQEGGRTLVHCVAGVSRSASLILAYLIKYKDMGLKEAFNHVHSIRPCIRPNTGFFLQLINFESELRGSSTVAMVYNKAAHGIIPDLYIPAYQNTNKFLRRCYGTS